MAIGHNESLMQPPENWFRQQVEKTRASIKAGRQTTVAADDVHKWLDSWGTEAEIPAPTAGLQTSDSNFYTDNETLF